MIESKLNTITIQLNSKGGVAISFGNGHLTKREIIRIIKALKSEHRTSIREFRKITIANKIKGTENENSRTAEVRTGQSQPTEPAKLGQRINTSPGVKEADRTVNKSGK
jgi:hypothetical protein